MHCDALTAEGVVQVTRENLVAGGCLLQCFAAFVKEGGYSRFCALADDFDALCARAGYRKVTRACEIKEDAVNALLTAEGGAFETLEELDGLYERGVRMAGPVWNTPTAAGFPNFPDYAGLCAGRVPPSAREGTRGLTAFGRQAVEYIFMRGMLVDVSHASDKLFWEVAAYKRPFVASHSNAAALHDWARNLTDAQLKAVADCGGVVGLNFCMDFLSDDKSAEGQRRTNNRSGRKGRSSRTRGIFCPLRARIRWRSAPTLTGSRQTVACPIPRICRSFWDCLRIRSAAASLRRSPQAISCASLRRSADRGCRGKKEGTQKRTAAAVLFSDFNLNALDFVALQAARADVVGLDLPVFDEGDLLNIGLERTLGLTVGVAHVVACRLTLAANTANSRHTIILPRGEIFSAFKTHGRIPARRTKQ